MQIYRTFATTLFLCIFVQFAYSEEKFYEELLIRHLPDGKIMTHFQFTTHWDVDRSDIDAFNHYNLFPKSIGQTIQKFHVDELHLSFTQGRWWYDHWNYPVHAAPVGVELWTWFEEGYDGNSLWRGLTSSLSGMFCAALEQMGVVYTSSSKLSFAHEGKIVEGKSSNYSENNMRYSALPREPICTENLTPWMKLLPCRGKAGLAQLLNSLKIYDTHFHSMQTHIRWKCLESETCSKPVLELVQTITIVFDPKVRTGGNGWSFEALFGRQEVQACPLAHESRVYIQKPSSDDKIEIVLEPAAKQSREHPQLFEFNLKTRTTPLTLRVDVKELPNKQAKTPQLTVSRFFTGWGQEFGGIAVQLFNNEDSSVRISYYELVPFYLRLYLHTLQMTINGMPVDPIQNFEQYNLIPGEDRSTPATLEFIMTLPPNSVTIFTIHFEKAFLHWTEHPPDAHRGFDIGSAVITAYLPLSHSDLTLNTLEWSPLIYGKKNPENVPFRVYTEGLLVSLPTPDFSMPYNVITLTGTIFALFFGSMFTTLVRRLKNVDKSDNFVSNRPIFKLVQKLLKFIDRE